MLAELLRNTSVYTLSALLSRGIGLLLLPIFTRLLTPEDYGVVDLLTVFGSLVHVTITLDISQGLARYLPAATSEPDRKDYATTCLIFTSIAYAAFTLISMIIAPALSKLLLGSPKWTAVVHLAIPTIALGGIFYLLQVQLSYELRARRYAATTVAHATMSGLLSAFLLVFSDLGVKAVFLGQLIAVVTVLPFLYFTLRGSLQGSFNSQKLRQMLAFSLPLVFSSIAFVLFLYIDRLIISRLLSLHDVGLFGVGQRVASVITVVMAGLQTALMPLIYRQHREADTPTQIADAFRICCLVLLLLASVLGIFAAEIVAVFAAQDFAGGASVVFPLALAAIFSNLYIFAPGLAIAEKTWTMALIHSGGVILNTCLSFLLTRSLGILGASMATLLASAILFGVKLMFSEQYYPIPFAWRRLAIALGICIVAVLMSSAFGATADSIVSVMIVKILLFGLAATGMARALSSIDEGRALARHFQRRHIRCNS